MGSGLRVPSDLAKLVVTGTTLVDPTVRVMVKGRSNRITLELEVLLAWTVTHRVSYAVEDATIRRAALNTMDSYIFDDFRKRGADPKILERIMQSRYQGYRDAWDAGETVEKSLWNVAKYFTACCATELIEVEYDKILPDPEDFKHIAEYFTPEALVGLEYAVSTGIPVHSLKNDTLIAIGKVVDDIASRANELLEAWLGLS